jgi:dTDP-4-amino-4,6-dideoxygalactose transaminase
MSPTPSSKLPAIHGGRPAFAERFPFIRPTVPALSDVVATYEAAYRSGLLTNSSLVARFEGAVAERLRVKHCVAVSSCTSGLMMVLRGLGLTGEVILPSFTFFATGHATRWNGLTPVFADCDPNTWNVTPAEIERKITPRTSAILAVHLYGNPCDYEAIEGLAARRGLKLIFDAAHAFGSARRGRPVGSFGDAEVFSLSPTKLLVSGEGGLVTTNDAKLAGAIRSMRNYGDLGAYNPDWIGLNARMSEFNAALGLSCLSLVDEKVKRRNAVANMYTELLAGLPGARFQSVDPEDTHTFKDYSIHVTPEPFGMTRDQLAQALLAENIETKKYFYPPLHQQDLYKPFFNANRDDLTQTEYITGGVLSLPIYESLSDETVKTVAQAIKDIVDFEPDQHQSAISGRSSRVSAI